MVKNYMQSMKPQRNRDKIFNAAMYCGIGFAVGVALCLHDNKETVQTIAGTSLLLLIFAVVTYKYLTDD